METKKQTTDDEMKKQKPQQEQEQNPKCRKCNEVMSFDRLTDKAERELTLTFNGVEQKAIFRCIKCYPQSK